MKLSERIRAQKNGNATAAQGSLDAVSDHSILDEFPHLLAAPGDVQPAVVVSGLGCSADLPEPSEVSLVLERTGVGQHHVHRLREATEGGVELGPDILGLQ